MQLLKASNIIVLTLEIFLCIGGFFGFQVVFGHGLGDIIYYAILYPLTIAHLIWTLRIIKKTNHSIFILPLTVFSITTFLIILKATIWRGPEYSWDNGNLFFSKGNIDDYVGTEMVYKLTKGDKIDYISIPDPKDKYLTELKVSVDKQNKEIAFIDRGSVLKPDTLRRYIQDSDDKRIIIEGKNPFNGDSTLQTAFLYGQICGVRNNKIVFYVKSWQTEKNGR